MSRNMLDVVYLRRTRLEANLIVWGLRRIWQDTDDGLLSTSICKGRSFRLSFGFK